MHETCSSVSVLQPVKALRDLALVAAGQATHEDGHGPDHVVPGVWPTNTLCCLAAEEVRIARAERKRSGAPIDRIILAAASQAWKPEQARCVSIVHEELIAKTIDFIGPDLAVLSADRFCIPRHGCFHFLRQDVAFSGKLLIF